MRGRMDLPWFTKINQQQLYEHVSTSRSGKQAWRSSFQHIQAREIQTDTSSNHCLWAMFHSKGGDGGGGGSGGGGRGGAAWAAVAVCTTRMTAHKKEGGFSPATMSSSV